MLFTRMIRKIACTDSSPLEAVIAFQAAALGIFLLLPYSTFESSQVYHILSLILPETIWGIIFLAQGVFELIAIHVLSWRIRSILATTALFLWMFVDISCWVSNPASGASVVYLTFALASLWAVVSLSVRDWFNCDD